MPGSIIAKYVTLFANFAKPPLARDASVHHRAPFPNDPSVATPEQKTALVGQIARACAVFCVDEVIVFDDGQAATGPPESNGYTAYTDPNYFLFHLLSYLETPPNLRQTLFPMHPDLRLAGKLPSVDMPHHLRREEWCPYREAVAVRASKGKDGATGTLLDCGFSDQVFVPIELDPATRVTVRLLQSVGTGAGGLLESEAVAPSTPREQAGYYWGYSVRQAGSLSAIFTESPFESGYDISIGTSERGTPVHSLMQPESESYLHPTWHHLLIVFGGVAGLEAALANDGELRGAGVSEVKELFDRWVNLVSGQGSRTIRTEEAVWIGLTALRPAVDERSTR